MKKIISVLITICMIIPMCIPVTAETSQVHDVSQIAEFILSEEEGYFEYNLNSPKKDCSVGSISKTVTTNGVITVLCKEGEKQDVVVITPDGEVYLNNEPIKVTTTLNKVEDRVSTHAHTVRYYNTPPGETVAADYSKLIRTEKKNIEFMQDLLDITESAFIAAVVSALGFNPLGGFAASYILDKIINFGGTVHPEGIYALSVMTYVYQRESGPTVAGYGTVSKLVTEWYAGKNQTNHIEDAQTVVYRSMKG